MAEVCDLVEDFGAAVNARQEKSAGFIGERCFGSDASDAVIVALISSLAALTTANRDWFASVVAETAALVNALTQRALVSQGVTDRARATNEMPFSIAERRADAASAVNATSHRIAVDTSDLAAASNAVQHLARAFTNVIEAARLADLSPRFMFNNVANAATLADAAAPVNRVTALVANAASLVNALLQRARVEALAESSGLATNATATTLRATQAVSEEAYLDTEFFRLPGGAWTALAQTWGMSRYTNMPFNSIAVADGRTLMFSEAGIYEATGDLDVAAQIAARMEAGIADFGSDKLKRPRYAYAGHTGGPLAVEVKGESPPETYTYPFPVRDAQFFVPSRAQLGRGLRSRYYQIAVVNQAGARFSLDDLRIIADDTSRRV